MNEDIKMALIILVAIVLTITVAILGSIYNNNKNVDRDKFFGAHCKYVKSEPGAFGNSKTYSCER